ncbi:hypothetical protein MIND_00325200 [Mycena indigotica]|uniref:TauD/TfdA-like domain-containing protein n=1 Tax=Mycena indigotica TaxID=2126181 RepID=A0A8H6WCA5_9AGAR|nr:uncharacterized protein MIND_00325200 [Mycena indigotica]KAF7309543.1 hypothetical protein MIND_00325200 [Mycena indigotica]
MGYTRLRKRYVDAASRARKGRMRQQHEDVPEQTEVLDLTLSDEDDEPHDKDTTTWQGGVSHHLNEWSDTEWEWEDDKKDEEESGEEDEVEVISDGTETLECLKHQMQVEMNAIKQLTWKDLGLMQTRSKQEWRDLTKKTLGGVIRTKGEPADSTQRRHRQLEREADITATSSRKSNSANSFRNFFGKKYTPAAEPPAPAPSQVPALSLPPLPINLSSLGLPPNALKALQAQYRRFSTTTATGSGSSVPSSTTAPSPTSSVELLDSPPVQTPGVLDDDADIFMGGYVSDFDEEESEREASDDDDDTPSEIPRVSSTAPPRKRQKLAIPAREMRRRAKKAKVERFQEGLTRISKLIVSKRTEFAGGLHGLQSTRARAIESCLRMVLDSGRTLTDASMRSAESHGFAADWGGRLLRIWIRIWLDQGSLPLSARGCHAKTLSILDDPIYRDEILSYLRSHKWATNPEKFSAFIQSNLITTESQKYLRELMEDEIPKAFRKYVINTLFPRIGVKVGHGCTISLRTAREWLAKFGWKYQEHKKALYYDGHERPDVVAYRQDVFIPKMLEFKKRLVEYVVGDVERQVEKQEVGPDGRMLVLVPHDEVTAQANDGQKMSWGPEGEQPLRKKGKGRGLHYSGVICSTFGHLKEAGEIMEYGKNYEGYWNGERFVKQLKEKIIPAFEKAHGPRYQALFLIDNSQGHSAYSEDALLPQRMNLNPGGKQARMRNGWYTVNGRKVIQPMNYPNTHPNSALRGVQKGMKAVLEERGKWRHGLLRECSPPAPYADWGHHFGLLHVIFLLFSTPTLLSGTFIPLPGILKAMQKFIWSTMLPSCSSHPLTFNRDGNSRFNLDGLTTTVWHSDFSFELQPPGGDTLYSSQVLNFRSLSPIMRDFLRTLKATHSGFDSLRSTKGGVLRRDAIETIHPVVRCHLVTGEEALYVNKQFTHRIAGMKEESDLLLNFLYDHIAKSGDHQARIK